MLHYFEQDLVFIGGGHGHVKILKDLGMKPLQNIRITIISDHFDLPYSGMYPGFIAASFLLSECHIDLWRLGNFCRARLIKDQVKNIDFEKQRIYLTKRAPIEYDTLSINTGSKPKKIEAIQTEDHAVIALKPLEEFSAKIKNRLDYLLLLKGEHRLSMIGDGAAGIEVILCLYERLFNLFKKHNKKDLKIHFTLLSGSKKILSQFPQTIRQKVLKRLQKFSIEVIYSARVHKIYKNQISLDNGTLILSDTTLYAISAEPPKWLNDCDCQKDEQGFISIRDTMQIEKHDNVFAVGDVATFKNHSVPRSGLIAVRGGELLAKNILRYLNNQKLINFRPQKSFLSILNLGFGYAALQKGIIFFSGKWVWKLKTKIDRDYVIKFNELPKMDHHAMLQHDLRTLPIRCGGCAAKIAHNILTETLKKTKKYPSQRVYQGVDAFNDVAIIDTSNTKFMAKTVDHINSFITDEFTFAKIATLHSINDILTAQTTLHHALAIITLPYQSESITKRMLKNTVEGIAETLYDHEITLVGGHSSEGKEVSIGIEISGFSENQFAPLAITDTKYSIVLTKAIGTGIMIRANMENLAKGTEVDDLLELMLTSNKDATTLLKSSGCKLMTDVSGFGLIGHLENLIKSLPFDAQVSLQEIPLLNGVQRFLETDLRSDMHSKNIEFSKKLKIKQSQNHDILYDPQTSGAMMAIVEKERANEVLKELHEIGYHKASIIGKLEPNLHSKNQQIIIN